MSTPPREEDEAWQAIVDNYGERPALPKPTPEAQTGPVDEPHDAGAYDAQDEEGYQPPPPPRVTPPEGPRLLAWIGLFGVPGLALIITIAHLTIPGWLGLFLLAWFVGGFGYLVATMRRGEPPEDGWDDGAVV